MSSHVGDASGQVPTSILIAPSRGFVRLNLREVWAYRELVYFLVWRDVKVRYKQTVFGVLWAVLQPLALMTVFSLFLGRLAGIAPTDVPYPAFVFAALVPWTLFAKSVVSASESLVGSANLIQKVYFPRLILPIAAMGSHLIDFAIASFVLTLLLLYFGITVSISVLWAVPFTALILIVALAAGIWLSALNVRYRDIRHIVPLLIQVWLFVSPVAYASTIVPAEWQWLYYLNPMAGAIDGFRWAVLGEGLPPPVALIVVATVISSLALVVGLVYFRRVERTFADVI
jgi:lipopolysaccharide transport system permease protein